MRRHLMYLDDEPEFGSAIGFGPSGPITEWFQSPNWFLLALIRHEGILQVGSTTQVILGDSALVIPPETRVRLERTDPDGDNTHFWIEFRPRPTGDFRVSLPWVTELGDQMKYIDPMFRQALDLTGHSRRRTHVLAWDILWMLSRNAAEVRPDSQLEAAEAFIRGHLAENISVSEIAEASGISHNHLIRLFRDEFGMTPSDFLRAQRVTRACHLLLTTGDTVKSIGEQVGYPSAQHFHRIMKSTLGIGPQEVRSQKRAPSPPRGTDE